MRRIASFLAVALALLAYLVGDRLHLAIEHHHACPLTGEPVHHEEPGVPCEDGSPASHEPHSSVGHLDVAAEHGRVDPPQAHMPSPPSWILIPEPLVSAALGPLFVGRTPDPPWTRLRPSRAPPLA